MTSEERYQLKLHKKQLDEKYLQKQIIKLNGNKSEILLRIKTFKRKHKRKYKNSKDIYLHQRDVIKFLNTNNRTIDLLLKERLIKNPFGFMKHIFSLSDITFFIHSLKYSMKSAVTACRNFRHKSSDGV
jgi:hypothetical protein